MVAHKVKRGLQRHEEPPRDLRPRTGEVRPRDEIEARLIDGRIVEFDRLWTESRNQLRTVWPPRCHGVDITADQRALHQVLGQRYARELARLDALQHEVQIGKIIGKPARYDTDAFAGQVARASNSPVFASDHRDEAAGTVDP